jgi:hypothetical protein
VACNGLKYLELAQGDIHNLMIIMMNMLEGE